METGPGCYISQSRRSTSGIRIHVTHHRCAWCEQHTVHIYNALRSICQDRKTVSLTPMFGLNLSSNTDTAAAAPEPGTTVKCLILLSLVLSLVLSLIVFSHSIQPPHTTCSTYPWWQKAVCRRSRVGKHCTGEHHSHRLLRRSEKNQRDPGTCKAKQTTTCCLLLRGSNGPNWTWQDTSVDLKWKLHMRSWPSLSQLHSPEQHLFQLLSYHGDERGPPSVEHVQLYVGCHDLSGNLCVCSHASTTAATEHMGHLFTVETVDSVRKMSPGQKGLLLFLQLCGWSVNILPRYEVKSDHILSKAFFILYIHY